MPSAGLSLRTGFSTGYSPMTPPSTGTPSGSNTPRTLSIAQQAYGIQGAGIPNVSPLPAYGSIGTGLISVAVLVFFWWSLPR